MGKPLATAAPTALPMRPARQKILSDARRQHVLDAARAVFLELGLEGTSVREIAQRAGYTPGAIYSYFASKEEVYAALLSESMERLTDAMLEATKSTRITSARRLANGANALFQFYAENPRDLDLGFYLFQGMQPRGLTPELNEQLNASLRGALLPLDGALRELGMSEAQALAEVTALFAHAVGLLVLSHTGRIRMFRQKSSDLFGSYLEHLEARALHASTASDPSQKP